MSGTARRATEAPHQGGPSAAGRESILARVRSALRERERATHPGALEFDAQGGAESFRARMEAAGARVLRADGDSEPGPWIRALIEELAPDPSPTVAVGHHVPSHLVPDLPSAPPEEATVGLSLAWAGAADSGSVILPSDGGRRIQLLPPLHIVWLDHGHIRPSLFEALESVRRRGMGAAVALHSGPSKSADIGRTIVTGVHGPGRLLVALF